MLYFCSWKDEDGRHYGVTNKHPKAYFNWPGCHLCNPMSCPISADQCEEIFETVDWSLYRALESGMVEVEVEDWTRFFNEVKSRLHYIF